MPRPGPATVAPALKPSVLLLGMAVVLAAAPALAPAQVRIPPLTTPQMLVQLARDHASRVAGRQSPADVLHVRTLLRAAARIGSRDVDAWMWLYELAAMTGDTAGARQALDQIVALDPGQENAFARWLELRVADLQSVEQREAWLSSLLEAGRPPAQRALVHVHLARTALEQLDRARAEQALARARQDNPEEPQAVLLVLELLDAADPPAERLAALLAALRLHPLSAELAWQTATLLDYHGLAEEALPFYEHAVQVHVHVAGERAMDASKRMQLARNAVARGDVDPAVRIAQGALLEDRDNIENHVYYHWLAKRAGRAIEVEGVRRRLEALVAEIKDPFEAPVEAVAQAAWYHCTINPQPERALMLAEAAAQRVPGDIFVTRVLGWARALSGRPDEARATLAPIAAQDPYAAYRLAALLKDVGEDAEAERIVRSLEVTPRAGPAAELLASLNLGGPATRPAAEEHPDLARAVAAFDGDILKFAEAAATFFSAEIRLENLSPTPGVPWWAVFSITNNSRFPITLGGDGMVNPVFVLSFSMEGDRKREYRELLTVTLDQARVIPAGGTVRLRRTVDVGPLRQACRLTPQQMQRVSWQAILDPQRTASGGWVPSPTGLRLRTGNLNRLPAATTPEAWNAVFEALRNGPEPERFAAIELMAEVLGEQQRAARRTLNYTPARVPLERIRNGLLAALSAESWELRVRTLESLHVAGLDAEMVEAARACLEHTHWLVRLMAVRLLARQGKAFLETAERIAQRDEDELVRELARSYVLRWQTPATAPAGAAGRASEEEGE
jgi:tetratricopeptide (TPR) repeat protein